MQGKEGEKIIYIYEPGAMTTDIQQVTKKWFRLANSASKLIVTPQHNWILRLNDIGRGPS
jgi:hypothetical protein